MSTTPLFRKFRTLTIAVALTFVANYGIALAVDSGASVPPPRPAPGLELESGASVPPPRPAPDFLESGASVPPPRP